jgi:hypothetical protein
MANQWFVGVVTAGVVAMLVLAGSARGAENATLEQIIQQQRELRVKLDSGDVGDLTPRRARIIRKAQDQVFQLADGKSQLEE